VKKGSGRIIAATYKAQTGCDGCPFEGCGCYGEHGNVRYHSRRYNAEALEAGADALAVDTAEAEEVRRLPGDGRALRLQVVGDVGDKRGARKLSGAVDEWQQGGGGDAWTYTHKWETIPRGWWGSISVLASCETREQVAHAHRRGYAAALTVGEWTDANERLPRGSRAFPCPHDTGRAEDCWSCRACWRDGELLEARQVVIFKARGQGARKVREVLKVLNP
jgi:hypothetical protein